MKVHKIICPECSSSMTSKAGIEEGTSINCPKCKNKFTVAAVEAEEEIIEDFEVVDDEEEAPKKPAAKPGLKPLSKQKKAADDEDEEETPKKPAAKSGLKPLSKQRKPEAEEDEDDEEEEKSQKPAAKSALKPLSKRKSDDDDEEEEDRPSKALGAFSNLGSTPARKKRVADDDDEDEDESPRSKRRSRDEDDDDDDRPRSKRRSRDEDDDDEPQSAYGKLKSNMFVRIGVLAVLLGVAGVLGYMLWQKSKKKDDTTVVEKKEDEGDNNKQKGIPPPPSGKKVPDNTGKKQPSGGVRHQGAGRIHFPAQGFSIVKPADWKPATLPDMFASFQGPPSAPQITLGIQAEPYEETSLREVGEEIKKLLPMTFPSFKFEQDGTVPVDGQLAYFIVYSIRVPVDGKTEIEMKTMQYYIKGKNKKNVFILTFGDLASEFNSHRKTFGEMAASVQGD